MKLSPPLLASAFLLSVLADRLSWFASALNPGRLACVLSLLLFIPAEVVAEKAKVNGVVVDASGQPVVGVSVADWWLADQGRMRGSGAISDAQGKFSLDVDLDRVLLAIDARQDRGGLIQVTREVADKPLTIRLVPLVTLRGEYFCPELNEPLGWCNTMIEFTTNRFRLVECRSDESRFELKLPPGEYHLNGYDGDAVFGLKRPLTLVAGQSVQDLGRLPLKATPMALSWGKPSPAWHITEARGMATNATVASFRGKWLLLDFWGYWCGPCVAAMPNLFKLYDTHASASNAFEIIAVHNGAESLQVMDQHLTGIIRGLWKGRTIPFPVLLDAGETTFDNFGV